MGMTCLPQQSRLQWQEHCDLQLIRDIFLKIDANFGESASMAISKKKHADN